MQRLLAVASIEIKHVDLIFKEIENISKRTKISTDILLQGQIYPHSPVLDSSAFKSYPYITLTIPNYEKHSQYLERACKKSNVFKRFILLISIGNSYENLVKNRSEQLLRAHCRSWNNVLSCAFDSDSVVQESQQKEKIGIIFGQMDIRGKISQVAIDKKFHLIENHQMKFSDELMCQQHKMSKKFSGLSLFFGLEVGYGKKQSEAYSNFQQFDDIDLIDDRCLKINCQINKKLKSPQIQTKRKAYQNRHVRNLSKAKFVAGGCFRKSPYLKKNQIEQIVLSDLVHNKNS